MGCRAGHGAAEADEVMRLILHCACWMCVFGPAVAACHQQQLSSHNADLRPDGLTGARRLQLIDL